MVLEKMKTLEITQDSLISQLDSTSSQLSEVKGRLNESMTSIFANSSTFRGSEYFLSQPMANNVAMFDGLCRLYGGRLVEPRDQQELFFVASLQKDALPVNDVMLGFTDAGHEGNWTLLSSGARTNYTKWADKEPGSANYNCAYLNSPDTLMYDCPCQNNGNVRFMCVIPL